MKSLVLLSGIFATVGAAAHCHSAVHRLENDVTNPFAFCSFWQDYPGKRGNSPFTNMKPAAVSKACSCVKATPTPTTSLPSPSVIAPGTVQCLPDNDAILALEAAVSDPYAFCAFWGTV